jgi:hypothetical protein
MDTSDAFEGVGIELSIGRPCGAELNCSADAKESALKVDEDELLDMVRCS